MRDPGRETTNRMVGRPGPRRPAAWCEGIAAKALEAAYLVVQLRQTPQGEHNYVKRRKEIVEQEQEEYDWMCMLSLAS